MIAPISQYLSTAKVFQFLANTLRGNQEYSMTEKGLKEFYLKHTINRIKT